MRKNIVVGGIVLVVVIIIVLILLFIRVPPHENSISNNSPEVIFNVITNAVKECNFEGILPLLSSNIQEKPFGQNYTKLIEDCNNLVSDDNCVSHCSLNENLFKEFGYSCVKICSANCSDKRGLLEMECIFNTRDYSEHTTSFNILRSEDLPNGKVRLIVTRTRDFVFSQLKDEDEVINVEFLKEDNRWKLNSYLYFFE